MKIKHKLLEDYQLITNGNKIVSIKAGTIIENYTYDGIELDSSIIDSNTNYFEILNWKNELIIFMKKSKIPQPAILSKKLYPFMEEFILNNSETSKTENYSGVNEDLLKDFENKQLDLDRREKRLSSIEDDIDLRLKRVQKREEEYKDDVKQLDKKEEDLLKNKKTFYKKNLNLMTRYKS
jgi:hypothetical protein